MSVHLLKLSVGAEGFDDMAEWVAERAAKNARGPWGRVHDHVTRMFPKRVADILNGGSMYWVIKGAVLCRQRIVGLEQVTGEDAIARCAILMEPKLVAVAAVPRRAFQGWRYLKAEDAPRDLAASGRQGAPALQAKLAELGLL